MTETISDNPIWNEQLELEAQMIASGATSFFLMKEKREKAGRAADFGGGAFMSSLGFEPVRAAVDAYLSGKSKSVGRDQALRKLRPIGADIAAAVAIKATVNWLSRPGRPQVVLVSLARRIGVALESEAMVLSFMEQHPELVSKVIARLDKQTSHEGHRRRVIMAAMRSVDYDPPRWSADVCVLVGKKMVEFVATETGMITVEATRIGGKTPHIVEFTPAVIDAITGRNTALSKMTPSFGPCIIPPKPWTSSGKDGGYWSAITPRPLKLVHGVMKELVPAPVVEAVNHLQETRWRVNRRVMEVAQRVVYEQKDDLGVLPPVGDLPLPEKPDDIATNPESRKAYRAKASQVYIENAARRSKRVSVARALSVAEQYDKYEAIYFPHFLDFRGRVYPLSNWLHPQGSDFVKGLLEFADGVEIGTEQGPGWLAIHGANCFGVDKVGLEDRIDWVSEHEDRIEAVASDPLGDLWWTEADSPFMFLAFCFEWRDYMLRDYDPAFKSTLPVMVDGSCNGIQHFSAMLRDEVGGKATNLVPAEKPADIYAAVAAEVIAELKRMDTDTARKWIAFGITRKITKRSVMVLPYGGTFSSCRTYVDEAVREAGPTPWAADPEAERAAVSELATVVWRSIGKVVIGARQAMAWLQSLAREVTKSGTSRIQWRTPSGLLVTQSYRKMESKRIETSFLGRLMVRFTVETPGNETDKSRHVSAFSPNFVHSLDASALMSTVLLAKDNGVTAFAAVHDSYGTHAGNMSLLAACIRRAFVDMYSETDVMAQLRADLSTQVAEGITLKDPPPPGSLDLSKVLESDFFFA
mgnify:CR=1 FL=1